jgi:hypothetical protein
MSAPSLVLEPALDIRSADPLTPLECALTCSQAIPVYPPQRDSYLPRLPRAHLEDGCKNTKTATLTAFRINTCKSVSKQRSLTPFRINTYGKRGEGGTPSRTRHYTGRVESCARRTARNGCPTVSRCRGCSDSRRAVTRWWRRYWEPG